MSSKRGSAPASSRASERERGTFPADAASPRTGRTHSSGALSSRKRRNTGCRSSFSSVHSVYSTSHTSEGSTQVVSFSPWIGPAQGGSRRRRDSSVRFTSASSRSVNPLPARPA